MSFFLALLAENSAPEKIFSQICGDRYLDSCSDAFCSLSRCASASTFALGQEIFGALIHSQEIFLNELPI